MRMEPKRTPNKINGNVTHVKNFSDLDQLGSVWKRPVEGESIPNNPDSISNESKVINNSPKPESPLDSLDVDNLIGQYESKKSAVFRAENGKFKPLRVIAQEIKLVLEKKKSSEQVNYFVKNILPKYRRKISSLNKRLKIANTTKEKEELSEQIRTTYDNLLHSVAHALHDESVPVVSGGESKSDEQKVRELESIFTELKSEFKEKGGQALDSRNWLEVQKVLGFIESLGETEQDPATRRVKMGRYLKNLESKLNFFRQEIEAMSGSKVEVSEEGITDNNKNEAIADTKFDYIPGNLPIGSGEVFAGDLAEDDVKQPDVSYVPRNNTAETVGSNRYSVFSGDFVEDSTEPSYTYLPADKSELEKGYNPPPPDIEDAVVIEPENNPISLDVNVDDPSIEGFIRRRPVNENGNTVSPKDPIEQNNLSNVTEDKDVTAEAKEKSEWRKAKEVYKKSEQEYNEALEIYYKNYYKDNSLKGKFVRGLDSAKKFFGINPELPLNEDLNIKKFNYRQSRAEYLESLNKALKNRAGYKDEALGKISTPDGKNYDFSIESDLNGDRNKRLFAKKFILDPNQERLNKQKELMTPEQQSRLASIMSQVAGTMAKNKIPIRIGLVTVAGISGALTGGLAAGAIGAGAKLSSILLGAFAAREAGNGTNSWIQQRIDKIKDKAEKRVNNFSLNSLNDVEDYLLHSYDVVDRGEKIKKVAGTGVAFAVGYGSASWSADQWPEAAETLSEEPVRPTVDHTARTVEELSKTNFSEKQPNIPNYSDESVGREEVSSVENEVSENYIQELHPDKYIVHDSSGNPTHVLSLRGISFDGDGFKIPASELNNVEDEIMKFAAQIITENPNISTEELESSVLTEIQNKFIASDWWNNTANVFPKIKIGEWYLAPAGDDILGVSDDISGYGKGIVGEPNDRPDGGENNPTEEFVKSSDQGLLSLVTPEQEDERFADFMEAVERNNRGPLSINSESDEVSNIPIKVSSLEPDGGLHTSEDNRDYVAEFVENDSSSPFSQADNTTTTTESVSTPPRPFSLSVNMLETPEYQKFIVEKFGGVEKFNQIVDRTVENFDNSTYDYFDKSTIFGKDYQSPYSYLNEKSMTEIDELSIKNSDEIKAVLEKENIKYETYLAWMEKIEDMKEALPANEETTLKDLYSRYIAENLDAKGNLIKPKS